MRDRQQFFSPTTQSIINGAFVGFSSSMLHPFSTFKCRMELNKEPILNLAQLRTVVFPGFANQTLSTQIRSLYDGFFSDATHKTLTHGAKYGLEPPLAAEFVRAFNLDESQKYAVFCAHGIAGVIAGSFEFLFYPIDTLKTKRQSGNTASLFSILRKERFGMFNGASVTLAHFPKYFTFFGVNHAICSREKDPAFHHHVLAASASSLVSLLWSQPLDVLKHRAQSEAGKVSLMTVAKNTLQKEGWTAFYKGSVPTLGKKIVQVTLFNYLQSKTKDKTTPKQENGPCNKM